VEGEEDARLRPCTDVDLEISPSTNTIPIRRLNLALGQDSEVIAAWVRFPALTVELLPQRYTRTGANQYRYASRDFVTDLEVDDLGLVTRYEGGWSREAVADPGSSTLKERSQFGAPLSQGTECRTRNPHPNKKARPHRCRRRRRPGRRRRRTRRKSGRRRGARRRSP